MLLQLLTLFIIKYYKFYKRNMTKIVTYIIHDVNNYYTYQITSTIIINIDLRLQYNKKFITI